MEQSVRSEIKLHMDTHQAIEMVESIATFKHDEEISCASGKLGSLNGFLTMNLIRMACILN